MKRNPINKWIFLINQNVTLSEIKKVKWNNNHYACNPCKWLAISDNHGAVSIRKTVLPGMAIPMLKIRRPNGRLIFNMEIAIRR